MKRVKWDRWAIAAEVKRQGGSLTQISLEAGKSESACRVCLINPNLPAADKAISDFINVPVHELWPDRYFPNGERRNKSRPSTKRTQKETVRQCEIMEAA